MDLHTCCYYKYGQMDSRRSGYIRELVQPMNMYSLRMDFLCIDLGMYKLLDGLKQCIEHLNHILLPYRLEHSYHFDKHQCHEDTHSHWYMLELLVKLVCNCLVHHLQFLVDIYRQVFAMVMNLKQSKSAP